MAKKDCPICDTRYLDVCDSDNVCEFHSDWLVTTCNYCGNPVFSDFPGTCIICEPKPTRRLFKLPLSKSTKDTFRCDGIS